MDHPPPSGRARGLRRRAQSSGLLRLAQGAFGVAIVAGAAIVSTVSACGAPECVPETCLNGVDYQTCDDCQADQCTVTAKSTAGEQIDVCTYSGGSAGNSQKNACYNQVHSAAESWCVMHAT